VESPARESEGYKYSRWATTSLDAHRADGRLWAINPEAGFFGVAPGTNYKTNPNVMETIKRNSIFTNVALSPDVCRGGRGWTAIPGQRDRLAGKPWTPQSGTKGAHPNSRFTTPASQCPSISPHWETQRGAISAILFGAARQTRSPRVPVVQLAARRVPRRDHGVGDDSGSNLAVGVVRRDPMAMLPFCGYNMGDYFGHWWLWEAHQAGAADFPDELVPAESGRQISVAGVRREPARPPVGDWTGTPGGRAVETPIGYVPRPQDITPMGSLYPDDVAGATGCGPGRLD